ncbi:MAG: metallophosphoesterase [Nitrospirae bacterium]|nr:metallophosphoesterase [Nitrospirota bacterium]
MILFLSVFLLLYGGMHCYLFVRARAAGLIPDLAIVPFALFLLLMISAPFIVRYAERSNLEAFARTAAWAGYLWLGWLFLFCFFSLAHDIYRGLLYIAGQVFHRNPADMTLSPFNAFVFSLLLSLSASVYGYFEALYIRTEHIKIATSKLPPGIDRLKIVQISDLHIGLIIREKRVREVIEQVKRAGPDILVSTGDLVDGQICSYNHLSDLFSEIRPKYGKYAITGNHEFYVGLNEAKCFIENAGFILLRGQSVSPGNVITIAGVDDPAVRQMKLPGTGAEKDLLSGLSKDRFRLLLKHRPLIDNNALGLFDLQLSGHVHRGQIFPFSILTWLYYPIQSGLADLKGMGSLYVSRGTGTWGPPIRFLSPPEITLIELVRE